MAPFRWRTARWWSASWECSCLSVPRSGATLRSSPNGAPTARVGARAREVRAGLGVVSHRVLEPPHPVDAARGPGMAARRQRFLVGAPQHVYLRGFGVVDHERAPLHTHGDAAVDVRGGLRELLEEI